MRIGKSSRKTSETDSEVIIDLDGSGVCDIQTGIAFFDHMLSAFAFHGSFDLKLAASGDLDVDFHHTVEDVGLALGDALSQALGDRENIHRFGHAVTPMDDALCTVTIDLSNRPYLVYHTVGTGSHGPFDQSLAKEFCRAFAVRGGMNLHINVQYGDNEHHIIEAIFKSMGRALKNAVERDDDKGGIKSAKGTLV